MRFTFPGMRTPSFFVDEETENGCQLHYRTKRVGFSRYVAGQLKTIAKNYYQTDLKLRIINEEMEPAGLHVIFELKFHNEAFMKRRAAKTIKQSDFCFRTPLSSNLLFGKVIIT